MFNEVLKTVDRRKIQALDLRAEPGLVRQGDLAGDRLRLPFGLFALLRRRAQPGEMPDVKDQLCGVSFIDFPQLSSSWFTWLVIQPDLGSA